MTELAKTDVINPEEDYKYEYITPEEDLDEELDDKYKPTTNPPRWDRIAETRDTGVLPEWLDAYKQRDRLVIGRVLNSIEEQFGERLDPYMERDIGLRATAGMDAVNDVARRYTTTLRHLAFNKLDNPRLNNSGLTLPDELLDKIASELPKLRQS